MGDRLLALALVVLAAPVGATELSAARPGAGPESPMDSFEEKNSSDWATVGGCNPAFSMPRVIAWTNAIPTLSAKLPALLTLEGLGDVE